MELQNNSQNNVTVTSSQLPSPSHKSRKVIVDTYIRSQVFQGVILGWVTSISAVILVVIALISSHIMDYNVIWNLRIGIFLSAVTVITRIMSIVVGFMLPAILAGIISFVQIPILKVSGTTISKLMEASMTRGLWGTVTACFNSGRTYKLTIIVASVLAWQYISSAVDLYLHINSTENFQQLPGKIISSARGINIATNCSETFPPFDTCGQWEAATNGGILDPARALKVYQNTSETLKILRADGGIYLIQSPPPEQAYSYSGSGIFLQPSCKPISKICNLKANYGANTGYICPKTLWSATGNTQDHNLNDVYVNVTSMTQDINFTKFTSTNPIRAIVSARYARGGLRNYDSEFVNEVHGDLSILLYCQIFASLVKYEITLGSIKAIPFGNLTNPQLVALVGASTRMTQRAANDVADVVYKGNSELFANTFAQQWAQATIASFSGAVYENGEGYDYVLEVNKEQTVVPLSAASLYAIVITFPPLIFSCVCLYSLRNRSSINWILAEFICTPQRLIYQTLIGDHYVEDACLKSLAEQERYLRKIEFNIKVEEGYVVPQKLKDEMQ